MRRISNKLKLLTLVCIVAITASAFLFLDFKPKTAFAAEPSTTREVYQGYADAPAGNWYNDNLTVSDSPMITVLTHGLKDAASAWSNTEKGNYNFAYDYYSLIENLRRKADANVFYAKMDQNSGMPATNFHLMRLEPQEQLTAYSNSLPTIRRLTIDDFSKHIIIVFEATQGLWQLTGPNNEMEWIAGATDGNNAVVYTEFNTMLNRIVCDTAYLTEGVYPKLNLIGHSRGGITNLTYAMDYPSLVDNIYSLGTPYLGSNFGRINAFSNMLGMFGNAGFNDIQTNIMGDYAFMPAPLMVRWNSGYESGRFSNIKVHAFAGDSSLNFYKQMKEAGYLDNYKDVSMFLFGVGLLDWPIAGDISRLRIKSGIYEMEDSAEIQRTPAEIIDSVLNEISASRINGDLFVSTNSQLGKYSFYYEIPYYMNGYVYYSSYFIDHEFSGFTPHTRYYHNFSDVDIKKVSQGPISSSPPIVHNLEARDEIIISDISGLINLGYWQPFTTNSAGNILTGLRYATLEKIQIPTSINGIPITAIENNAFARTEITELSFESGSQLQTIGFSAFENCTDLRYVLSIPSSVKSIGNSAFYNCSNLKEINYNATNCANLSSNSRVFTGAGSNVPNGITVNIGSNVTRIPDYLFYNVAKITEVSFQSVSNVQSIGNYAFSGVMCSKITIPSSVKSIGDDAFRSCSNLTEVTIPSGVTSIGECTFYYCRNLTSISIPNSVKTIGAGAFYHSNLVKEITIPSSVTSMGEGAFNSNTYVTWLGNIEVKAGKIIKYIGNHTSYTIPDFVTAIGEYAFYNALCDEIVITGNTVLIEDGAFKGAKMRNVYFSQRYKDLNVKDSTFADCVNLKSIILPKTLTTISTCMFSGCNNLETVYFEPQSYVTNIGFCAFMNCKSLLSIEIPENVLTISHSAFEGCTGLKTVRTLSNSLWLIGNAAFANCRSLTSIAIPDSVTTIGVWAFADCLSLDNVDIANNQLKAIDDYVFYNCASLTNITIPDNITKIGRGAFTDCIKLNDITLPTGLKEIGIAAFSNNKSLVKIFIPETVDTIGIWAFADCVNLTIGTTLQSKPSGWDNDWNSGNCPVVWGVKWQAVANGNLDPNKRTRVTGRAYMVSQGVTVHSEFSFTLEEIPYIYIDRNGTWEIGAYISNGTLYSTYPYAMMTYSVIEFTLIEQLMF